MNTQVHSATNDSPYRLVFGQEPTNNLMMKKTSQTMQTLKIALVKTVKIMNMKIMTMLKMMEKKIITTKKYQEKK